MPRRNSGSQNQCICMYVRRSQINLRCGWPPHAKRGELPTYLLLCLPTSLSTDLSMSCYRFFGHVLICIDSSTYPCIYLVICLSEHLPVIPSFCPLSESVYLPVYLFIWIESSTRDLLHSSRMKQVLETFSIFDTCHLQNELTWQRQKRSNSERIPSNTESWVQSWRPRAITLWRFFMPTAMIPCHLSQALRQAHETIKSGHTKCCKISSADLKIWCSNTHLSGNQRVDLLRLQRYIHLCRPSSNVPHLPSLLRASQAPEVPHTLLFCSLFGKVLNPLLLPGSSQLPKMFLTWWRGVLCALWLGSVPQARAGYLSSAQMALHPPL